MRALWAPALALAVCASGAAGSGGGGAGGAGAVGAAGRLRGCGGAGAGGGPGLVRAGRDGGCARGGVVKRRSLWGWIWRAVMWAPVLGVAAALIFGLFAGGAGLVVAVIQGLVESLPAAP